MKDLTNSQKEAKILKLLPSVDENQFTKNVVMNKCMYYTYIHIPHLYSALFMQGYTFKGALHSYLMS